MFEQGSIWRKWDLHIHSPLTILNNQYPKLADGTPDWESFLTKLESLDIAVLGITDYFTIDGYKKIKEFKEQGRLANIYTILPNIEFRLNSVLSSKKDGHKPRRLNFHVIFSDEVSVQDIEEHFLHDLHFFYEGNPQDEDDTRKLKSSNIAELGNKLIEQHKNFKDRGLSPLQVGVMQTVVNHEDINKCIEGKRFKGKYIIVFPEELSNLIDWDGQDHHIRKGLLQKSDIVFSSNTKTRSWCLGQKPYREGMENFINEFRTLKPCIHGSDAHELTEVGYPCSRKGIKEHRCGEGNECDLSYCWIKADPTFEGLKQLLYEPLDRVKIQQEDPTPIKSNYTLKKFKISQATINDDLSIKETNVELNSGLVAVTGSKGGGKTAFVDLIANCFIDRCNTNDANSFVRRITDENPTIKTTISFRDAPEFKKDLNEGFFEDSNVVYIAQGELENYIGDDSDLDDYVRNLIFDSPKVKDTVISFEFDELVTGIDEIQEKIAMKNDAIVKLEKQTSPQGLQTINLEAKQKEAELKDIEKRLKEFEKAQSEAKIELAKEKEKTIAALKSTKNDLMSLKDAITEGINFLDNDVSFFNENIARINALLKKLKIDETFENITYESKELLEKRLTETRSQITKTVTDIEIAQKELDTFEAGVKDHTKLLDKRREIDVAIADVKEKREKFNKREETLKQALKDRKKLLKLLIEKINAQKKKYEDVIATFSAQKADVLSDLSFGAKIYFDKVKFLKTAEDVMDNRRVRVLSKEKTEETMFDELFPLVDSILNGNENNLENFVTEIEKLASEYKTKLKSSQAITTSDFYRFLYSNYFVVIPIVKYKNTQLSKLSLGQKATVLIKIYLAQGDKPIIIDSHDEHLDNEFIMDELVKAIRQAKEYRQVILASNNGNVVINSDAEQIIIANRKDGVISYNSGSIENPTIRDRSVKVLEGGPEAFRKRQQKYRLER